MARIPYEEVLRNRRIETFVRSPLWERFEGGHWRRYRKVRVVSQCTKDGLYWGGYADGADWHWTPSEVWEDDARRSLFALVEAYAEARDAKEKAARLLAKPDPLDLAEPPLTKEELEDFAEPTWTKEELADFDFVEEVYELTDEERQDFADFEAEIAEMVKEGDWTPLTPPVDFPPLPEND